MANSKPPPVALVTGGSAGLGLVISKRLLAEGYRVVVVSREPKEFAAAGEQLGGNDPSSHDVIMEQCDVTQADQVAELFSKLDRLDVLVNVVGVSDRGLIADLAAERMHQRIDQNVLSTLLCSQAGLPLLEQSRGVIVNIGSLSAKVGARYLGAYTIAKHALAGLTGQMRLELKPSGVHVGLVNPGPIRRDDAGTRYNDLVDNKLPAQAAAPAGGAKLKGIAPERVAGAVVRCINKRVPDIIVPRYMRLMITLGHAFPRLGDWLLIKFTS